MRKMSGNNPRDDLDVPITPLEFAQFIKPDANTCIPTGTTGHKTCPVKVKDTGKDFGAGTVFAFRAAARCYPAGSTVGASDPDTAPALTLTNSAQHIWERVDVAECVCDGGQSNDLYV